MRTVPRHGCPTPTSRPPSARRSGTERPGCHEPATRDRRDRHHVRPVADLALPARSGRSSTRSGTTPTRRPTATSRSAAGPSHNYRQAWEQGQFGLHFDNSLIITVPAVFLTLFLASMVAFVLARFSYRFNLTLLGVLPRRQPAAAPGAADPGLPDVPGDPAADVHERHRARCSSSFWALILVNIAFQLGFCTFVLSNYMKTHAARDLRVGRDRRRQRVASVLAAHDAPGPTRAGGAGDPAVHLDLQRVLLGDGAARRRATSSRSPARSTTCAGSSSPTPTWSPPARCWWRCRC